MRGDKLAKSVFSSSTLPEQASFRGLFSQTTSDKFLVKLKKLPKSFDQANPSSDSNLVTLGALGIRPALPVT